MPLINTLALLSSSSIAHLTLSYYLLTNPAAVAKHSFVAILGASMGLPPSTSLEPFSSSTTAFAASILAFLAVADLAATSLPEEIYSYYWSSQAPIRLLFFFVLTGWAYIGKPGGLNLGGNGEPWVFKSGGLGGLSNALVFTWGFVEMMWWFWIYVTLRDERRELTARKAGQRRDD